MAAALPLPRSLESAYEFLALADAFATGFSLAMTAALSLRDGKDAGEVAMSRDVSVAERTRRLASAEMWAKGVEALIVGSQQTLGLPPID